MFDIGFFEILIICFISLVILGPSRLPAFITSVEEIFLKLKSGFRKLKQELYSEGFENQKKEDDWRQKLNHLPARLTKKYAIESYECLSALLYCSDLLSRNYLSICCRALNEISSWKFVDDRYRGGLSFSNPFKIEFLRSVVFNNPLSYCRTLELYFARTISKWKAIISFTERF